MNDMISASYVELAEKLVDASGDVIRPIFRGPIAVDRKADKSPVTVADREAERVMREMIETAYPGHGIIGEEFGTIRGEADYVWVLDPIDGTKSFITGKPLFGTLVALAYQGRPVLGIIDQPVLHERWIGAKGRPTTFNGTDARVRPCEAIGDAMLYATEPAMFKGDDEEAFGRLSRQVCYPLYGADCYAYGLLASGYTDLVVEASLGTYDYCALVPVVEGAGGVMTDWSGQALTISSDGRVIAAGDARIQAAALALLTGA